MPYSSTATGTPQSTYTNTQHHPSELERVERLRGSARIKFWAAPQPWAGFRLVHMHEFAEREVSFDPEGNIARMPLLIGKPCFGMIPVFLRFGQTIKKHDRNGILQYTRCGRCKVRDACHKVCEKHLKLIPDAMEKRKDFVRAGGAAALDDKHFKHGAEQALKRLIDIIVKHGGFKSINDDRVIEYYDQRKVDAQKAEALRKFEARRANIKKGMLDDDAVAVINRHRTYRTALLQGALKGGARRLHPSLRRLPPESVAITSDAWFARELLKGCRQPINPSAIAKTMIRHFPMRYIATSHNTLRSRVVNDLKRVELLERLKIPGNDTPIWPSFDLLSELDE